jgi:hypothetical protein
MANDTRTELLALENDGWNSLCESTGDTFYGALMTDDAVMVLANGMVMDRDAVMASLAEAPPWDRYDISEVRWPLITEAVAILTYVGRAFRGESEPAFTGPMTSVYVRQGDGWRLALYQQTSSPTDMQ